MSPPLPELLSLRAQGRLAPPSFHRDVTSQRLSCLSLSPHREITPESHSAPITAIDLETCENRYLLAGAADGTVYLHDLRSCPSSSGEPARTSNLVGHVARSHAHKHDKSVECVRWYPGDHGVFTTSAMDGKLKVWDTNELKPVDSYTFEGENIYCHDLSALNGHQLVVVGTALNHINVVDLRSGANAQVLRAHSEAVLVCKWSNAEEHIIASGGKDGKVYLWDVRRGKSCIQMLDYNNLRSKRNMRTSKKTNYDKYVSHDGPVNGLAFSEDGRVIFTYGRDGKIRKWDLESGKNLKARFPMVENKRKNHTHFSLNGKYLFVPSWESVLCMETDSENLHSTLNGHYNTVNCVAHNVVEQEIYSGGNDRNILIWEGNCELNEAYTEYLENVRGRSAPKKSAAGIVSVDTWSSSEED